MNVIEKFTKDGKTIEVYGTFDEPLFKAYQVGKMLGMTNIRVALRDVKDDWKVVNI